MLKNLPGFYHLHNTLYRKGMHGGKQLSGRSQEDLEFSQAKLRKTQSSSASEGEELNKAFLPPNSLLPQVTHGSLGTSLQCHACIWILPLALGEDLRGGKQQIQPATAPT